jgi:2-amino-4-hydroxy-6-hydroxymethyldihydropteridine diphosphokinase
LILLGIGSNLGDREQQIVTAIRHLTHHPQIVLVKASSLYETEPVGVTEQPRFLNAVIDIDTVLSPPVLLEICLETERRMGRIRSVRWGPRIIDIDILLYKDIAVTSETLCIPHPRMWERNFVLVPLREVTGDAPVYHGMTPSELMKGNADQSAVAFYKKLEIKG